MSGSCRREMDKMSREIRETVAPTPRHTFHNAGDGGVSYGGGTTPARLGRGQHAISLRQEPQPPQLPPTNAAASYPLHASWASLSSGEQEPCWLDVVAGRQRRASS